MTRSASIAYVALLAAAAALLAALWLAPGPLASLRHWQAPPAQAPNLDDVQAALLQPNPAATALDPQVIERPLFSRTRRPPAPEASPPAPEAPPEPVAIDQVKLQGVLAGPTLSGVMIEQDGATRFVRVGEKIGDWILHSVAGRTAVFRRGGQRKTLEWPADVEAAAANAAAAATAAAVPAATAAAGSGSGSATGAIAGASANAAAAAAGRQAARPARGVAPAPRSTTSRERQRAAR